MKKIYIFTIMAISVNCFAQNPQYLDTLFANQGIGLYPIANTDDGINDLAIQADGKIVAVGFTGTGIASDFAVTRFNADGTFDNSFGNNGKVITDIIGHADIAYAVAIQNDGKIVVAGSSKLAVQYSSVCITRYNTDGTIDNTFNPNGFWGPGIVTKNVASGHNTAYDISIEGSGKITIGGNGDNYYFILARFNSDGSDDIFNHQALQYYSIGNAMTAQLDGKYVVAGGTAQYQADPRKIGLIRFTNNGVLDPSFDTDGKVTTDAYAGGEIAYGVTVQPTDGKIIAVGVGNIGGNEDIIVLRYNLNGALDNSFSTDGKMLIDINGENDCAYDVVAQANGKITISGYATVNTGLVFVCVRLNADGTLDTSFGINGILTVNIGFGDEASFSLAVQTDGKILLGGISYAAASGFDFAAIRILPSPIFVAVEQPILVGAGSAYPNPAAEFIQVDYEVLIPSYIYIEVYDIVGHKLLANNQGFCDLGQHSCSLDLSSLSSGTYLISIKKSGASESKTLTFIKQ